MADYYDVVLGLIPVSLAGLTALLMVADISLSVAIPAASVVTIGLMGHAMFVNGPGSPSATVLDEEEPTDSARTSAGPTAGNVPTAD